jgi:hypothetical protein
MSTPEPFCHLVNINSNLLTKNEMMLLEVELFSHVLHELKTVFTHHHKDYFRLLKFTHEMESAMIENHLIRYIINDILSTGEYSLEGIAYHTQIPEEVIFEIATGLQECLSLSLSQKIIELHRMVRNDLYQAILQKCKNKVVGE